ncbi:MAG TPA: hypothetical protein VL361_15520 [Candidatus Limnocylindrales bacterium]|nr:hypothetical protein [Candidatus Limnocylindrales bacterium]
MKFFNSRQNQAQLQPNASAPYLCLRLMSSRNENEVDEVRRELLKAGIASEKRRHPIADAFGVSGVELWVQNERDFFNATKLYARVQHLAANRPEAAATSQKADTSLGFVGGPKLKAEASGTPKDASKVDSRPAVKPRCAELKQASSLLQKGIEEMLLRESELASECASLHSKVEELTRTLAQAQADAAREIKSHEAAERNQAEQFTSLLASLERERQEWQQKLKSSDDSCQQAKQQADALSLLLQTQQAVATALKKELAALELQRDEQERALSDAHKEIVAEREARVAAEERAGFVEESLQTQWVERQELVRQIQAHAASLGSLLTRSTSKAVGSAGEP